MFLLSSILKIWTNLPSVSEKGNLAQMVMLLFLEGCFSLCTVSLSECSSSWQQIYEIGVADSLTAFRLLWLSNQKHGTSISTVNYTSWKCKMHTSDLVTNTARVRVVTERHLQLVINLGHVVGNWRDFASNFSPTQASRLGWSWARTRTWAQF